ncbi:hypothetical protein [Brachybacterium sacelli]|uniref:hypothetical protein n=1 Tax=Brachybacterium sacelli TaxID=173364 RepID=UPI00360B3886
MEDVVVIEVQQRVVHVHGAGDVAEVGGDRTIEGVGGAAADEADADGAALLRRALEVDLLHRDRAVTAGGQDGAQAQSQASAEDPATGGQPRAGAGALCGPAVGRRTRTIRCSHERRSPFVGNGCPQRRGRP